MLRRAHPILVLALVVTSLPMQLQAKPRERQPVDDPVIAAVGDIACDPADPNFNGGLGIGHRCHQRYTSDLVVAGSYDAVLALGDQQYECGGYQAFLQSYDPTWGRVKAITHPVPGNHEYYREGGTNCRQGAAGYFRYFGSAAGDPSKGYYSFNLGSWHIIGLNSNCSYVSCDRGSPQERWLAANLAKRPATCTLVFAHHPRFSADSEGPRRKDVLPFWKDLFEARADLYLAGHRHFYDRFAKLDPSGNPSWRGIREFIVGTGGRSLGKPSFFGGSEFSDSRHFGILELTLHPTGYDWRFLAEDGSVLDSGSGGCVA